MATCDHCGQTILFGGVKDGEYRYCNASCASNHALRSVEIPAHVLEQEVRAVHQGSCPECKGSGPVDLHRSYRVYSALVFTRWSTRPALCCRSCAVKKKLGDAVFSGVLGWWGFPWGLIMTPIQVLRNLGGVVSGPDPSTPSPDLYKAIRGVIVNRTLAGGTRVS